MTGRQGLTLAEAADALGVSPRTMQRYVQAYNKGDRSRGFVATRVMTQRGKGYEYRIDLDAATPADTSPAPPRDVAVTTDASTPPDATGATTEARELVAALLRALDDQQREVEGWARRYGRLEAEVESLRRAQTGPLRRLWRRLRGSDA